MRRLKRPSDANAAQSHQVDPTFVTRPPSSSPTLQRIWRRIFHLTPLFVFEETISFLQNPFYSPNIIFYIPDCWQGNIDFVVCLCTGRKYTYSVISTDSQLADVGLLNLVEKGAFLASSISCFLVIGV